jgi:hypothetical protein
MSLGQCGADFAECAVDRRSYLFDTANSNESNQSDQQGVLDQILTVFATEE